MAWIEQINPDQAEGRLARIYAAGVKRAGRVYNIVRVQSQNPPVLQAGMGLYMEVMHGDSPLTRAQREMMAVVVSRANDCHYWTQAHAENLRVEVHDDEWVRQIATNFHEAELPDVDRALCELAEKLTKTPGAMTQDDVARLRGVGLSDRAIHDAIQTIAYFNYINRIADGLGVDLEPEMPPAT